MKEMEEYDNLKAKKTSKTQVKDEPHPEQVNISESETDMLASDGSDDPNDSNDSDDELESGRLPPR